MKTLLTFLLLSAGLTAVAQRSSLHQDINDDGKTLRIRIDAEQRGRSVHYHRTFDVKSMSKEEKEELVSRVIDSLGIMQLKHDVVIVRKHQDRSGVEPDAKSAGTWSREHKASEESQSMSRAKTWRTDTAEQDGTVASSSSGIGANPKPFSKTIQEDPVSGRLKMHYEYTKDGEQFIFERTVNAQGKSEKEKQRLIEETEKSLGLPNM